MKPKTPIVKLGLTMSPRVWLNARIDLGATCLFSLFNVVLNQFYVAFAIQQGASHAQVGILTAAPAVGLIFSPLWANWIEKRNRPLPFVILPNLLGRLLLFFPALFASPSVYVAVAIAFQLLMGIQAPAYASLVSRMYPADVRGRLMGYVRVAMGLLMIPLAYVVGSWADASGPSGPLIAASIAGTASIILFRGLRIQKQRPKPQADIRKFSLKDQWALVRGNRRLAVFLGATTFAGFGNMMASPLYQIIQVDVLDLSNVQIGFARMAYYCGLLVTFLIAGYMIDRFDIKYTLMCGIGAYAIVPALYGLWGTYSAVIIGNGIQGIGEAIWDIGILSFVFRLAPGREAAVFGVHLMLFGFRGSIGPLLSTTVLQDMPLNALLLSAAACGAIGTAMFVLGNRKPAGLRHRPDLSA
ncbi:MFS transporter [Paenibacillus aurantiacus]|uniref:MFS transporter n=1 Tax=Paenibacillus aurantiacus TaxID=1936118 RepID=A0ABV5KXJ2_9BACL